MSIGNVTFFSPWALAKRYSHSIPGRRFGSSVLLPEIFTLPPPSGAPAWFPAAAEHRGRFFQQYRLCDWITTTSCRAGLIHCDLRPIVERRLVPFRVRFVCLTFSAFFLITLALLGASYCDVITTTSCRAGLIQCDIRPIVNWWPVPYCVRFVCPND
jgi:hypothetical protein